MNYLNPDDVANTGTVKGQNGVIDCGAGQAGTSINAKVLNPPTYEIMAVIEAAGLTPDGDDWTQLSRAIDTIINETLTNYVASAPFKEIILNLGLSLFTQSGGKLVIADGTDGNGNPTFTPAP